MRNDDPSLFPAALGRHKSHAAARAALEGEWGRMTAAVALLEVQFAALKIGTPEQDGNLGPVINPTQRARSQAFIDGARAAGVPGRSPTAAPRETHRVRPGVRELLRRRRRCRTAVRRH